MMAKFAEANDYKVIHNEEIVEGFVIAIEPKCVYIDIPLYGTGVIMGREFINTREVIKNLNIGDSVKATTPETMTAPLQLQIRLTALSKSPGKFVASFSSAADSCMMMSRA